MSEKENEAYLRRIVEFVQKWDENYDPNGKKPTEDDVFRVLNELEEKLAGKGAELKAILDDEYEPADPPDPYDHDAQYYENLDNHSFDDNYETYEDGTYKG